MIFKAIVVSVNFIMTTTTFITTDLMVNTKIVCILVITVSIIREVISDFIAKVDFIIMGVIKPIITIMATTFNVMVAVDVTVVNVVNV